MIDKAVIKSVEAVLSAAVLHSHPVSGGDINEAYRLQTTGGQYFIKINSAERFPDMFKNEADGLAAIRATGAIKTPNVIHYGEAADQSFFLMEWIDAGQPTKIGLARLGEGLANLHRHTANSFGFNEDNYIGSLHQSNKNHESWSDFYIEERLNPLLKLAVDSGKLNKTDVQQFEQLYAKLPGLFDPEPPALLHGDPWNGNFLIDKNQQPYLIDPAVYYGNREMDIALTMLFGGFGQAFYDAYQYRYPLQKGFEQRLKLWNLYPLLVHVNLFGGGYVQQVRTYVNSYA